MYIAAAWMLSGLFLSLKVQGSLLLTATPKHIVERWPLEVLHMILQDWSPTDPLGVPSLLTSSIMDFALVYGRLREPIKRQQAMAALYWQRDDLHPLLYSLPKLQNNLELARRTIFRDLTRQTSALDRDHAAHDELDSPPQAPPLYRGPIGVRSLHMSSFEYEERRHLVALMLADYPARMPSLCWQPTLLRKLSDKTSRASPVVTLLVEAWPLLAPITLASLVYRLDRKSFNALLAVVRESEQARKVSKEKWEESKETNSLPVLTKSMSLFSGLLKVVLGAIGGGVTESKRRFMELLTTPAYHDDKKRKSDPWMPMLLTLRSLMEKQDDHMPDEATVDFVEEILRQEMNVAENIHEVALVKSTWLYFHIWAIKYWQRSPRQSKPEYGESASSGHGLIVRLEALIRDTPSESIPIGQREILLKKLYEFPHSPDSLCKGPLHQFTGLLEALTVGQWTEGTVYDRSLIWDRYFRATRRMVPARRLIISPRDLDDRHEREDWSQHDDEWIPEVLDSLHFVKIQGASRGLIATNRRLPRPLRVVPAGEAHLYLADLMAARTRQAYSAAYGILREVPPGSGLYCWALTPERLVDRLVFLYSLPFLLHQGIRINMTPFPERDLVLLSQDAFGQALLSKLCPPSQDNKGENLNFHATKGPMARMLATSLTESLSSVMQYATWTEIYDRLSAS